MDYLERKYKGKKKENIVNVIYLLSMAVTAIAGGMLIYGYIKKDIVDKRILFLVVFFMAFIMCVALTVKSKMHFKYERLVWLAIEAIICLVLSIVSLLVLV